MIRRSLLQPRADLVRKLGSFARRQTVFLRAVASLTGYVIWILVFRLLVLTVITYFLSGQTDGGAPLRFEEISEAFSSNEITLMGLAAGAYVLFLRALNPLTTTSTAEIITPQRLERRFLPGFFHGAVLACGMVLAFLLSGLHQYLGFFVQFENVWIAIFTILLRTASIVVLVYSEEFIFRHKLLNRLRPKALPDESRFGSHFALAVWVAVLYCAVKALQFDLSRMQFLTLFLLSVSLAIRTFLDNDFGRGAGFLAALLVVFHPLLSLPVFGSEFNGVVLIKPQPDMDAASRLFTGGAGGPLASLALQLLLVLDILKGTLRYREISTTTMETL